MNLKLLACVACSAALLLGACSSNNTTGTSSGGSGTGNGGTGGTGDGDGDTGNGDGEVTESRELMQARTAVERALNAETGSDQQRATAIGLIETARMALQDAVRAAETAVREAQSGTAAQRGAAARARTAAIAFQRQQNLRLDRAAAAISWLGREMKRSAISRIDTVIPARGANTVSIERTPRMIPTSETDDSPKANPDAIKSDTFDYVKYSDGKVLLSGGGSSSTVTSSEEFKVDGDVVGMVPTQPLDTRTYTGLTLTNTGLSIRVGGTRRDFGDNSEMTDYTDMRKDITAHVDDADASGKPYDRPRGQNGWDLTIAFNEPLSTPIASGGRTSWQGNGDFYWRGIVSADRSSQLLSGGDNYKDNAFNQPDQPVDQRDLGTYEVWLSNHFNYDKGREPSDPNAPPYTADDRDLYLNYAAYGLFIYTASPDTFLNDDGDSGHESRVQSMSFGYQAFENEAGKRTRDIGKAILSGEFIGETLATIIQGRQSTRTQRTTLLRGDASLSVTIPKDSATAGRLRGTLSGFEEWVSTYWQEYKPSTAGEFSVRLDGGTVGSFVDIGADGSYSGTATAVNAAAGTPTGTFKGNFYGPRANADDLETVGTWNAGPGPTGVNPTAPSIIIGSFGAKQRPAPAP